TLTQRPPAHFGVAAGQSLSAVHWGGPGWHTPFTHALPGAHWLGSVHVGTHWPLTHDFPSGQSLGYLQAGGGGCQVPASVGTPASETGTPPSVPAEASEPPVGVHP
ncbi:MAG TPA: hypothetical protein VNO21_21575, partial [Polyangiaceae bacterium]|nr:hypothetical protein [Polyangiaceae bacterium]